MRTQCSIVERTRQAPCDQWSMQSVDGHRRTYGALSIATRHPRLFQRLASQYRPPADRSLA